MYVCVQNCLQFEVWLHAEGLGVWGIQGGRGGNNSELEQERCERKVLEDYFAMNVLTTANQ